MKKLFFSLLSFFFVAGVWAQDFEEPKIQPETFEKVKAGIGADFAMQYQAIDNYADNLELMPLGTGLNLPTANFTINGDLAPGMRVTLTTYLSSRHHNESWVKGGYLLIDQMPFLNCSMVDKIMKYTTVKVGVWEPNYGDSHFRRSDNGKVTQNAFVGNYIMDSYTTAPMMEVLYRKNGLIGLLGTTSGTINQNLVGYDNAAKDFVTYDMLKEMAFYGKVGIDKQINEDFRVRLTGSFYEQAKNHRGTLYTGDRAGARYYSIMVPASAGSAGTDIKSNHTNGRWGPGATYELHALMFNLFAKYKALELFTTYEKAKGTNVKDGPEFDFDQFAIEGLARFGKTDQFYIGARYNTVKNQDDLQVDRVQIGGGWFLTKNVLAKVEYVDQNYKDFPAYGPKAGFDGVMVEAAISF
jgi:hypothetical protein